MMARSTIRLILLGAGGFGDFLASLCEAFSNAHIEDTDIDIFYCEERNGVIADGMLIAVFGIAEIQADAILISLKPASSMVLFVGWLMTILPPRASVVWRDGWPHIHCPPNDDRDDGYDPMPLVPNELVPA